MIEYPSKCSRLQDNEVMLFKYFNFPEDYFSANINKRFRLKPHPHIPHQLPKEKNGREKNQFEERIKFYQDIIPYQRRLLYLNYRERYDFWNLKCPICFGFFIFPVSLSCGHSYCRVCLLEFLLTQDPLCLLCNSFINEETFVHTSTLHHIAEKFSLRLGASYYKKRLKFHLKYLRKRSLFRKAKVGMKIDIHNSGKIWEIGVISKMIRFKKLTVALVEVISSINTIPHKKYIVSIQSNNAATYGFYTSRLKK